MMGYPVACINPSLQGPELCYAINKGKCKALVTMDQSGKQNFLEVLEIALKQGSNMKDFPLKHIIVKSEQSLPQNYHSFDKLLSNKCSDNQLKELNESVNSIAPESPICIQFTSGTTGQPKAALLTNYNLTNQCIAFGKGFNLHNSPNPKKICLSVPMFHVYGLTVVVTAMYYGGTLVAPFAGFNPAASLDAVEKERCDCMTGTPTMYVDMLAQQSIKARDLSSLKLAMTGGATCSPELHKRTKDIMGLDDFHIVYGQSETTAAIFMPDGNENQYKQSETVGRLFEHLEAKVINADGETVNFGQPGQLCLRGYPIMQGYLGDEQKTKETLTVDGWMLTG